MIDTIDYKYYQSITEIPLNKYVDCIVDSNLSALIISGEPPLMLLADAWQTIQQEYADAIGDDDYQLYCILLKEVGLLEIDICLVQNFLKLLECYYDELFATTVNDVLRTKFKFDWRDQDTYRIEIQRSYTRCHAIEMRHELKKAELEAQDDRFKEEGKIKKPTREYFQSVLISLSDHAKYNVTDQITVYQFCDRIRRLNKYVEQMNTKS